GRGVEDCQRVLNSLTVAGRTLLWALQGYLEETPCSPAPVKDTLRLQAQLVVGHEEYRRVTYRDIHFRRAFAEVFRHRSLLFLGAGIQESYLQELFGEVLELFGPTTRAHYAFLRKGEVDAEFMLARFQIVVLEYENHARLPGALDELAEAVNRPRQTAVGWRWGGVQRGSEGGPSSPALEIVRGPLPAEPAEGECLAVSTTATEGAFSLSRESVKAALQGWGVSFENGEPVPPSWLPPYLGQFGDRPVYAVRSRKPVLSEGNLTRVYLAARALFEHVQDRRHRHIHIELLATGHGQTT